MALLKACLLVCWTLFLSSASACSSASRPACDPSKAAKLEAEFVRELVAACTDRPEGEILEECPEFEPIRAKFKQPRIDAMAECQ